MLKRMTSNPFKSILLGAGVTAVIQSGFVFSDLLTNFERVSDHCSNLAVGVIELDRSSFDTHEYLRRVKDGSNPDFMESFREYSDKYVLTSTRSKKEYTNHVPGDPS